MNWIKLIISFLGKNKWLIYVAIVLTILGTGVYFGAKIWRAEMQRQENNYMAALEQIRNDNKESQRIYNLSVAEVRREFPDIKQQLKDMDIKLKNVSSAQNVNTVTTNHVNTILRDSTIQDTIKVQVASFKDQWTDFKLLKINDSIRTTIITKDSIFIVLHKIPRNLWQWLRAEPRNVQSTVKNFNPNAKITYNRLIQIGK